MAKRRNRTQEGQAMVDNPETTGLDEALEETPTNSTLDSFEAPLENVEAPKESSEKSSDTVAEQSNSLAPVELELKIGSQENILPEKVSKEKIEAAVKEKLSRKTDSAGSNPFVPQTQLDNEVKEVAKAKGFPLSRGTEIGARLLARSKRRNG